MCNGFGVVAMRDGRLLFIEPDGEGDSSHSEILKRAGIKENKFLLHRNFVRVDFADWTEDSFRWDEYKTLPIWADDELIERCKKLLLRVAPIWDEYKKARSQAWAEYIRVRGITISECEGARTIGQKEYGEVWAAAMADMVKELSTIPGYVPELEVK